MEVISGVTKCALCRCELLSDNVKVFVDEAGYLRLAHSTCFVEKYEEVEDEL